MKNKGQICNLSELKIMQQAIEKNINIKNKNVKRHLLDMGITKGVKIKIKKIAPMGDPVDIELRGYELAIRKKDLKDIEGIVL